MSNVRATTISTATVEIDHSGGYWGGDCTVDQTWEQGKRGAEGALRRLQEEAAQKGIRLRFRDVRVKAVITKPADDKPKETT